MFVLLGIGLLVFCFFYRPFEPHYRGKKLSTWVAILTENDSGAALSENGQREQYFAAKAIQTMGTKALPYAIELCRVQDSPLKTQLLELADDDGKLLGCQLMSERAARARSWRIFHTLGPAARPAIPALIQLLQDTNREIAAIASSDLICIGPEVIPPMIELLTNQNARLRAGAAMTLTGLGRDFQAQMRPALPLLLRCLNDEDLQMRVRAAYTLEMFEGDAPAIVPALIESLKRETNAYVLMSVGRALASFGTNAQAAIPVLVEDMRSDESGRARFDLMALRRISPEIADAYFQKLNMARTNPPPDASISNLYSNYFGKGWPFGSPRRPPPLWRGPAY